MLLSLYIHANNVELITQTLVTLTEYCQGPCHENQVCCVHIIVHKVCVVIVMQLSRMEIMYIALIFVFMWQLLIVPE